MMPFALRLGAALLAATILPSCHDEDSDEGAPPLPAGVLGQARVGIEGGTVSVQDPASPYAGTALEVPAGALSAPTDLSIRRAEGEMADDILVFEFGPAGTALAVPARFTIKYSRTFTDDFRLPTIVPLRPLSFSDPLGADVFERTGQDPDLRLVTFQATRLGRFTALLEPGFAEQWRFLAQDRKLVTEALVREVDGELLSVSGARPGATPAVVGKGSVDAFWGSARNLLLVHSTADDALQFTGSQDLIVGLSGEYDNIVTYQYRSGRPIAENANWLYNEVKRRSAPGFRTDVLGYSMGGLVVRYFVERSKDDPARAQLSNFDAARASGPLSGTVGNLITLGAPHQGAVDAARAELFGLSALLGSDVVVKYFPSIRDLSTGPEGTGPQLNALYADDPSVRYFLVAGESDDSLLSPLIPGDDDGLVSVSSALGVPGLVAPEATRVFPLDHSELHTQAVPAGVRDQIVAWIRLPR